ncbi:MAG: Cysteine desulfuration protein SufE [Chlamydiales bacterium]|nr:Cysteine desulfuration protein SufE [Chlamydiales bacterium]MCH9635294.1 Cysteine desulfuration protein SufE [Chlamydiales bacterium]MCH9704090.1 SufE family protein [Chlamydiota bacterium]
MQRLKQLNKEELYQEIMKLELEPFDPSWKYEENLVTGCQSVMYLKSVIQEGKIYFYATSDALISRGLAALMISIYNGKEPEAVLKEPPTLVEELNITSLLSPSRANGLAALHLKMKQQALSHLVAR